MENKIENIGSLIVTYETDSPDWIIDESVPAVEIKLGGIIFLKQDKETE